MSEIENTLSKALMIVGGYAFIPIDDKVSVLSVSAPYHSVLMRLNGEVLETNMEDVELDIVADFWNKNHKLYEEVRHA